MFEKIMHKLVGKKMQTVTFHMKSRNAITFKCERFRASHDNMGTITEYSAEGVVQKNGSDPLFWVSLGAIESITVKK